MTKRIISLLVIAMMLIGLLAACGNKGPLTIDDAKKVVLKDMGIKESQADSIDVHPTTVDGVACYAIFISVDGEHMEYLVDGYTGDILAKEERDTGHSH